MSQTTAPSTNQTTDPTKTALSTTEPSKTETKSELGKAPDKYADFTAPEGTTLNKEAIEAAVPVFKELGLSQDQAQKLVELQAKRETEAAKAPQAEYTKMRDGWKKEVLAIPELSSGSDLKPEVKATIGRAIDAMGDAKLQADFRKGMDLYGWGDNPAVVQGLYALGKLVTEGRPVQGKGPTIQGQTEPGKSQNPGPAKALFPNLA